MSEITIQEFGDIKTNLVFDGDSISLGVGASPGHTLSEQVLKQLTCKTSVHVVAQGGQQLSQCLENFESQVGKFYEPDAYQNIVFLKAGDNDVTRGISAQETHEKLLEYVELAHNNGWKVVVASNLQRFDVSDYSQCELTLFNNLVIKNKAGADAVIDFAADPILGGKENRSNLEYYNIDGVHPADAGYRILAHKLAFVLNEETYKAKS